MMGRYANKDGSPNAEAYRAAQAVVTGGNAGMLDTACELARLERRGDEARKLLVRCLNASETSGRLGALSPLADDIREFLAANKTEE